MVLPMMGSRFLSKGFGRLGGRRLFSSDIPLPNFPADFGGQISREISGAFKSPAYALGFFGGCCNWFLGASAVYDATQKGPEIISLPMTCIMICYSSLFARWAGWAVGPRNYILCGSHIFNVCGQTNQLRRCLQYKVESDPKAKDEVIELGKKAAVGAAVVTTAVLTKNQLQALVAPIHPYFSSPAGPFTIHPWPPVTKIAISGTSLLEYDRPTSKISISQYSALTVTGAIFSAYGLAITPVNYPLTSVNVLLFLSSAWHLGRKIKAGD